MSDGAIWYLSTAEGPQGPYSAPEIQSWIASGAITSEWYVWRDGFSEWRRIAETPEIAGGAVKPCPACGAPRGAGTACPACGILFAEWDAPASVSLQPREEKPRPASSPAPASAIARVASAQGAVSPERPGCITTLCILIGIGTCLTGGLLVTGLGAQATAQEGGGGSLLFAWLFVSFFLYGACCYGLWNMKKWGVYVYTLTSILDALLTFGAAGAGGIVGIGVRAGIILYLFKQLDSMRD